MKIGLIGNMNNNNFALMRYFRDLGADAHLLLYTNDGTGSASHFTPESDSWDIKKWEPFIHRTEIPNAPISVFDFPLSWLLSCRSLYRYKRKLQPEYIGPISRNKIQSAYKDYDVLVGSGITPGTLTRIGRGLDIFYPYSLGVEYLSCPDSIPDLKTTSGFTRLIFQIILQKQLRGILDATMVLNGEPGFTKKTLDDHKIKSTIVSIPMVYTSDEIPANPPSGVLKQIADTLPLATFSVLHHARLVWERKAGETNESYKLRSKNNHWFLRAFAELCKQRPTGNPLLLMVEYGPDVEVTKHLAAELGIASQVVWLPKMQRKELRWLLSKVSAGVGQFYQLPKVTWGGTGWEVMASGKPLLNGYDFEHHEFKELFGYDPPPLLAVTNESDILSHLLHLNDNPDYAARIGSETKAWFDINNGSGLACRWLQCLNTGVVNI